MKIPFFRTDINDEDIATIIDVLKSGWIATGKVNKEFSNLLSQYNQTEYTTLVDSATAGLEMALRYIGLKEGDEVITTPYTYAATAHVIKYCGATPVFVDICKDDFSIDPKEIKKRITSKTKAVISVDFAGFPVDYDSILEVLKEKKDLFDPSCDVQKKLGRIFFLSDAAHSLGAMYKGNRIGSQADITVFSFHAVKNITTAEGGAMSYSHKEGFDGEHCFLWLKLWIQHGQSKTALEKSEQETWFYDIEVPGFRHNLPDLLAALGLSQFKRYQHNIDLRLKIMDDYYQELSQYDDFILPLIKDDMRMTNGHFFPVRLKDSQHRNSIISEMLSEYGVSLNVHFIPLSLHTAYKNDHNINDTPKALWNYEREISLPVYKGIGEKEIDYIVSSLLKTIEKYR